MAEAAYYLTVDKHPKDASRLLAVISLGSPQRGDEEITICSVTSVKTMKEAKRWYRAEMQTKPWETRQ